MVSVIFTSDMHELTWIQYMCKPLYLLVSLVKLTQLHYLILLAPLPSNYPACAVRSSAPSSFKIFDHIRKYSTEFSISWEKIINIRFHWWNDITSNMYTVIGTWNLCLNILVSDLTKGKVIWLDEIYFRIDSVWWRNIFIVRDVQWRVKPAWL